MTTKASDFSLETQEFSSDTPSQEPVTFESSEFKKILQEEMKDPASISQTVASLATSPPSLFDLVKPLEAPKNLKVSQDIAPSTEVLAILEDLGAYIGLLTHEIFQNGIQTTSVVITKESSMLDGVEIELSTYDTAPGFCQIEINSCHKLEALLHSHERSFVSCILQNVTMLKVDRLDLNGKSINLKQDRIDGSLQKKVTKAR